MTNWLKPIRSTSDSKYYSYTEDHGHNLNEITFVLYLATSKSWHQTIQADDADCKQEVQTVLPEYTALHLHSTGDQTAVGCLPSPSSPIWRLGGGTAG